MWDCTGEKDSLEESPWNFPGNKKRCPKDKHKAEKTCTHTHFTPLLSGTWGSTYTHSSHTCRVVLPGILRRSQGDCKKTTVTRESSLLQFSNRRPLEKSSVPTPRSLLNVNKPSGHVCMSRELFFNQGNIFFFWYRWVIWIIRMISKILFPEFASYKILWPDTFSQRAHCAGLDLRCSMHTTWEDAFLNAVLTSHAAYNLKEINGLCLVKANVSTPAIAGAPVRFIFWFNQICAGCPRDNHLQTSAATPTARGERGKSEKAGLSLNSRRSGNPVCKQQAAPTL